MLKVKLTVFREGLPANWNSGVPATGSPPPFPAPLQVLPASLALGVCALQLEVPWVLAFPTTPPSREPLLPCPPPPLFCLWPFVPLFSLGVPDLWVPTSSCCRVEVNPPLQQRCRVHKGRHLGGNHTCPLPLCSGNLVAPATWHKQNQS